MMSAETLTVPTLAVIGTTGAVLPYLLGAAITYVWFGARDLVPAACLIGLAASLLVLGLVLTGGPVAVSLGGWPAPLGIQWRADGLSAVLLVTTAAVGLGAAVYARHFFPAEGEGMLSARFQPLLLFLLAALSALFLSGDVFNLYVTLELSGLAAVALVAVEGSKQTLRAALRYLFVALASATSFLLGVALLYGVTGTLDLHLLGERLESSPATALALALMTVGLMGKTALFPLHGWLPPAHGSAPPPSSALLSGLVVKGSYYMLLRLWIEVFQGTGPPVALLQMLGVLGAGAVLWGAVHALRHNRLKLILAYSTVAQLGYLLLVFPLMGAGGVWASAALGGTGILLVSHALAKSAMFLAVGVIVVAAGHDRVSAINDAIHQRPMAVFALGIGGLTLSGLPPSGGFLAKWHLLWASIGSGQWWWAVVLLGGSALAMAYTFRILSPALRRCDPVDADFEPVPKPLEATALVLALLSLLVGVGGNELVTVVRAVLGGGDA